MTLEDHAGDVISKARAMTGVDPVTAAALAGITQAELLHLEKTGLCTTMPDLKTLAPRLDLDAAKLLDIFQGWLPGAVDINRWRKLGSIQTAQGSNTVNACLAWDESTHDTALFDTGYDARPVHQAIEENRLRLRHIFLTHSHQDHIAALDAVCQRHPGALIHCNFQDAPEERRNRPDDCIRLGTLRITHRATPGHCADGATYVIEGWPDGAPPVAVVGDALFAGSIGRGFQSWDLLRRKIREQIFTLPPETLLFPGHGPLTTVAGEMEHNPFFRMGGRGCVKRET
jgi:glyoxylase-like metal-dependent hydrolase (beta-lactamase superfamily II)